MFPFRRPDVPIDPRTQRLLSWALGLWITGVAMLGALAVLAIVAAGGLGWRLFATLWVPAIAVILATFVASAVARRLARACWTDGGRVASASLLAARGWCPGCRTWLAGRSAGAGNAKTCPRCSSTWRVGGEGICPGCGYDMSAVPATAGPLAICPECATLSVAALDTGRPNRGGEASI